MTEQVLMDESHLMSQEDYRALYLELKGEITGTMIRVWMGDKVPEDGFNHHSLCVMNVLTDTLAGHIVTHCKELDADRPSIMALVQEKLSEAVDRYWKQPSPADFIGSVQ